MSHIFISYSHKDSVYVHKLAEALEKEGFEVWIDDRIHYGSEWPRVVTKNLDASDGVVVILSNNSYESDMVHNEVARAREKNKPIFPLLFDGENWLIVQTKQYVDIRDGSLPTEKFYKRLEDITPRKRGEREAKQKAEREATKKAALEEARREVAEKFEREKIEVEARKKLARENIEREALANAAREKTEREKIEREAVVKADREIIEQALNGDTEHFITYKVVREKKEREVTSSRVAEPQRPVNKIFPIALGIFGLFLISGIFVVVAIIVAKNLPSPTHSTPTQISISAETQNADTSTPQPTPILIPAPPLGIGSIMISEKDGATLVYVPEGEFTMGSDYYADEGQPIHTVYLDAFWIDQTEVTNKQYQACVVAGVCEPPSSMESYTHPNYYGNAEFDNFPVIYVDWEKANRYCEVWAGEDLPTEAQWEKAARGTDKRIYPWGNDMPNQDLLNYNSNIGDTTEAGSYATGKSFYGAFDMAGNVWEWTNDWYDENYYQSSSPSNPLGPDTGRYRVLRGGSWSGYGVWDVRAANRDRNHPSWTINFLGFRCARSP